MKKKAIKIIIALILYAISMVIKFENEWINNGIFIISYIIVGFEIVKKAIRNIFRGKVFDENFLMTIATIGAFGIGEYPEAVAVMLFYQVGELFQSYAVDKSRKSIASLMDIRPDFANLWQDGDIKKVDPDEVKIGDKIIVKPGEKIPLDGIILEGKTTLDTKALTGESSPREVLEGEEVLSGCINLNGVIKVEVKKEYGESTVSKILELVENASSKKSKSENFITKFAKYYTPIVVIIAVILAIVPPLILGIETFSDWIYRALSFLVVSCPCALVISIPLSFFGGIGGASKMGILVKGSNYLEALSHAEIVVFDKTGTLTKGVFEVQKIEPVQISKEELLEVVAYAENYSNHPISESIKQVYERKIKENEINDYQELSGLGITAKIKGKEVLVGNEKLMNTRKIEFEKCNEIGTILYVAIENKYAGYILISDTIKEDAKTTIHELKKNNIKQTVMLTGDRKKVGENVAEKLGMDKVYTDLLPADKVEKVEELLKAKSEKGKLVFVGDGINDSPVLTLADIGIAMGGLGADSAIEAADIVIMTDEPSKLIKAIKLSKKTMRIVRENIIFAIFVKIVVLVLTAVGVSTMWEAVFADVGVSIIAILNALRALRKIN
ncbi:MAG TPA: cadmium-translocating P-type ATPase [Candidatus Merdicola faecigallinarum]|uniref:Cadmium-translocating P-type ATPase n=1 Tax=Candidatus Merdicola faecigallinarum TaxID=2840862 RepID=A0A9D1S9E7_9FIRM|nr:cadmium-translocating P-type ATPase [Candidatus Merdicola faecigallinarum]